MIKPLLLLATLIVLLGLYAFLIPRRRPQSLSPTSDQDLQWEEYRTLNKEIERRERSMIMMGSIFLPISLLILGQATTVGNLDVKFLLVCASMALYSIWLFAVQGTSWWLDEITYARIRGLEEQLGIEVHCYVGRQVEGNLRIYVRRHHWAIFLVTLFVVAIIIMSLPPI